MTDSPYGSHYSVLYRECLDHFNFDADLKLCFADLTFGAGGHSTLILEKFPNATLYGVDQDPDALKNGAALIKQKGFDKRATLLAMNYEKFPLWAQENQVKLDGILLDLGVSSHQFDTFDRGFSFREDAPLDMRMNYHNADIPTAADFLHNAREDEIADVIWKYGEERLSRRIASEIVARRVTGPILRTKQLEDICFHAYPKKFRFSKPHPATRTFQALRIHVNDELGVLERSLESLFDLLNEGGKLEVISFHSLEDRIVKHTFKEIFQKNKNAATILTKRPLIPSQQEVEENSRSRSAKLRIIQKNSMEGVYDKKKNKKFN